MITTKRGGMRGDWLLLRREAAELAAELHGARIRDAGALPDGRFALAFGGRGGDRLLVFDAFGPQPSALLERGELAAGGEPRWVRPLAAALIGWTVIDATSVRGDRVLILELGRGNQFGVRSEGRFVAELVPRFGNLLALRGETIVALARQFTRADNEVREALPGRRYQPPPPPPPHPERDALEAHLANVVGDPAALRRLPVLVYRDPADGRIIGAHLVELPGYAQARLERHNSLLDVLAESHDQGRHAALEAEIARRRERLLRTLSKAEQGAEAEARTLRERLAAGEERERLLAWGNALYAHLNQVPARVERFTPPTQPELTIPLDPELDAKGNAAAFFKRYRKLSSAIPHMERRLAELGRRLEQLAALRWEAERVAPEDLADVERAVAMFSRPRATARERVNGSRKRKPLMIELPSGARVLIGRSPSENAHLTFGVAGGEDLWFHAKGVPGAHVILRAPPGSEPGEGDIESAARAAALHSKSRQSASVAVDYTKRKRVRKQHGAPPGLVWYDGERTIHVTPG
ncbi:DUF814 domain-containing protein [bacterium]|nr:MAG: DUF814 domain-containing protein [bacterium]